MANEYLKRKPTQSGDQRVFTFSAWVKPSHAERTVLFGARDYQAGAYFLLRYNSVDNTVEFSHSTGTDCQFSGEQREVTSWVHVLLSVDTSEFNLQQRAKCYINGVQRYFNDNTFTLTRFAELMVGDQVEHQIGLNNGYDQYFKGEMFDAFYVDGLALSPETFGKYYGDTGYQNNLGSNISAQSIQLTEGKWIPKLPRSIISEINSKGGFGVNGFYMPMNDGSNPGADFHCAPNTIIKLKGEDDPQPKNGDPETTDGYISQLREDKYKDYLEVAVPGIHINLIENGTFDTDTTGWTAYNSVISSEDGQLKVDDSANVGGWSSAVQVVPTVVGETYTLSVDIGTGTQARIVGIFHGTYTTAGTAPSIQTGTYTTEQTVTHTFTATNTTTSILLTMNNDGVGYFDNVKLSSNNARDFSADIKGSGSNVAFNQVGNAAISKCHSFYGTALSMDGSGDYFETETAFDLNLANTDFTVEAWVYANNIASSGNWNRIFDVSNGLSSGFSLSAEDPGGVNAYRLRINDGVVLTSTTTVSNGQWTHLALVRDSRDWKLYINGYLDVFASGGNDVNYSYKLKIGANDNDPTNSSWNGFIQDFRIYKGIAKYKQNFEVSRPFTPVNFGASGSEDWRSTDSTTDNYFCKFTKDAFQDTVDVRSGGLTIEGGNDSFGMFGLDSGKWYWENQLSSSPGTRSHIGICSLLGGPLGADSSNIINGNGYIVLRDDGTRYTNSANGLSNITGVFIDTDTSFTTGQLLGIELDLESSTKFIKFYLDGTLKAHYTFNIDSANGVSIHPFIRNNNSPAITSVHNFGQNSYLGGLYSSPGKYTDSNGIGLFRRKPTNGFLSICTKNLPEPEVLNPGNHFKPWIYNGSGSSRFIRGLGFKPGLIWIKNRTTVASWGVYDIIRGPEIDLRLDQTTTGDGDYPGYGVMSFDDDGFTIGGNGSVSNSSGDKFVAYCWKAGDTVTANTDGTIPSQVSVNQEGGFSVVSYTGNGSTGTVGTGLTDRPAFTIIRERTEIEQNKWWTYWGENDYARCTIDGNLGFIVNDGNNAVKHGTSSTPGLITLNYGNPAAFNILNADYMIYTWAERKGYSKFGKYRGNNYNDFKGPYIYCGFRPAFIIIKAQDTTNTWIVTDSARRPCNPCGDTLFLTAQNVEATLSANRQVDFLSNGFKIRVTSGSERNSGLTYWFAAFAEAPFKYANGK